MEGLTLDQLDHEFIGQGDPNVEAIRLQEQYEQNLTPEEIAKMRELAPAVEQFFLLDYKGKTGEFPKGEREIPIDRVPEDQQMDIEEYGRMQGIPEEEIDSVMTDLQGPRQEMAPDMSMPSMPTAGSDINMASMPTNDSRQELALGTDDLQQQEQIQGMPPVQEVLPGAQSGLVQDPQDPSGVKDTVPMDNVEEGTAIINAASVKIIGLKDLIKARDEAREILRAQGKIVDDDESSKQEGVDIAVSNGEFMFTKAEAEIIGQETIDKWNKKGAAETEQAIAKQEGQPAQNPNQVGVQPVMGASKGVNFVPAPPQQKPIFKQNFVEIFRPAVMQVESSNRPDAVSKKGAVGLMQVRPIAVKDVLLRGNNGKQHTPESLPAWLKKDTTGNYDMKDAETNKWFGSQYLNMLYKQFDNPELATLAYNLGPTSTQEWINNGSILSRLGKEALEYVPKVYKALGRTPEIFTGDEYLKALEKVNRKK